MITSKGEPDFAHVNMHGFRWKFMAPSSSRARNSVMKIAERSSLKILPSPNTNTHQSFSAGTSGAMQNHAHLVLLAFMRPPFASECDIQGESSDDVIPLKWRTMKTVFLLALASARRRSYIHTLSVAPGRCMFSRGNTQRQLVVSLLPEPRFLAKNQLPSQAPEQISILGIAHLNPIRSGEDAVPCQTVKALPTGLGTYGASTTVHSLESQHQGYHEKPHQPMDGGDCQRSLHSSW